MKGVQLYSFMEGTKGSERDRVGPRPHSLHRSPGSSPKQRLPEAGLLNPSPPTPGLAWGRAAQLQSHPPTLSWRSRKEVPVESQSREILLSNVPK